MDYKVDKKLDPLVAAWHRAQRILEGLDGISDNNVKPDKPNKDQTGSVPKDANTIGTTNAPAAADQKQEKNKPKTGPQKH
jgi:hypothetical protein